MQSKINAEMIVCSEDEKEKYFYLKFDNNNII